MNKQEEEKAKVLEKIRKSILPSLQTKERQLSTMTDNQKNCGLETWQIMRINNAQSDVYDAIRELRLMLDGSGMRTFLND